MSGTRIEEVGERIYRINTPLPDVPGGFSLNQYLIDDDEPVLVHTGPRGMFSNVRSAIEQVMPVTRLRWLAFFHVESDESGALNQFLAAAPHALPLCSKLAALVSMNDLADRPPRALGDGETLQTGSRKFTWIDAPHVPHGWENGFLFESTTRTLFCGDLFTQPGADSPVVTTGDILGPSEAFRRQMDYYAHAPHTGRVIHRLADTNPAVLACMHGSAWKGDGAQLLRALGASLETRA